MSQNVQEILERLQREHIVRTFAIDRGTVDIENRTIKQLAFATDKPIDHWFGQLELNMEGMRRDRLMSGAPLLMDHNRYQWDGQIGRLLGETLTIKKGVARIDAKVSRSERAQEILQDVDDDIRSSVSVGFIIYEMHLEKESKNGPAVYRSDDWEPIEVSLVAVPADPNCGVGRSADPAISFPAGSFTDRAIAKQILESTKVSEPEDRAISTPTEKIMTPEEIAAQKAAEQQRALELADTRRKDVLGFAEIYGEREMAEELLLTKPDATQEDIRLAIVAKREKEPKGVVVPPMSADEAARRNGAPKGTELARIMPRFGKLTSFKGDGAEERAYRFGQWLLGHALFDQERSICVKARKFCDENGLSRAMSESVNETGGYTVPPEFGNDLIDLREQYGVFRRNARIVPMASDTRTDPRRTGGLTAYFPGEAGAITPSDMAWDQVELVAKKLAVLARYSSELNEDSILNLGDTLAGEIAYAFAEKEDRCGFLGDGTSTYGGITGATTALLNLSATRANIAGLFVGTGNQYSELVLTDFEAVVAKLPQYADTDRAAWYVHRTFYWNTMVKLMLASGGVTAAEIEDARRQRYMGYRVEFTQVMPSAEANDQVCALFGDLSLAASFGVRRDTQIAFSEHSRFANDQIEIRGTERFDINVHDVGNASATAALRVPGPIVGLLTAAS